MIYLDNAATSFPKPAEVSRAMVEYMVSVGANPGRSGYDASAAAARIVFDTRSRLAQLVNAENSRQVVFTKNATEALNIVLYGFQGEGDEVVVSGMEHNAVMRPLKDLEETSGLIIRIASCNPSGSVDLDSLRQCIGASTRLVVINHASNVTGTIQDLGRIRSVIGSIPLLVDAAQTAGAIEIDVQRDEIDFLAITGHKSLLGPQGTGCLYIRPGLEEKVRPLIRGGTGSSSEKTTQPQILPDRFEAGTMNTAGVAGLGAALRHVSSTGITVIHARELQLTTQLVDGLSRINGLALYGPAQGVDRMPVVSFTLDGVEPGEIGRQLASDYAVACRIGLHCAPLAHKTIGTYPAGTVRLSAGYATTAEDIDQVTHAITRIATGAAQ